MVSEGYYFGAYQCKVQFIKKHDFVLPGFADTYKIRKPFSVWDIWRGDALFPSRKEVILNDIAPLLEAVLLCEFLDADTIVTRPLSTQYEFVDIGAG